jgi:hypothetical protein
VRRGAALALAAVLGGGCGRDPRPDVLLIVLDTVRADHLSVYGYARDTTPALAELARDGVLYRNAIAPDTWTAPSHASLLTGLMPTERGVHSVTGNAGEGIYALAGTVPTLTQRLRAAGYRTTAFIGNGGYLHPGRESRGSAVPAGWGGRRRPIARCTARSARRRTVWLAALTATPPAGTRGRAPCRRRP